MSFVKIMHVNQIDTHLAYLIQTMRIHYKSMIFAYLMYSRFL